MACSSIRRRSTTTATFVKTDTTTQGNWMGVYGTQGYNVVNATPSYPSYATVTASGYLTYVWSSDTTDVRGLENPNGSGGRIAAAWYSSTSFTVTIDLTDGLAHNIALYAVDWDSHGRSEQIQISNASTGAVLDTETLSSFVNGAYEVWTISGDVKITIKELTGGNAVLNGLFFDPASSTPSPQSLAAASVAQQDVAMPDGGIGNNGGPAANGMGALDFSSGDGQAIPLASSRSADGADTPPLKTKRNGATPVFPLSGYSRGT